MASSWAGLRWPKVPTAPESLPTRKVLGGGVEADKVTLHLREPEKELEAEGGWLGVDAVGATDDGGVLELESAAGEDVREVEDAGADFCGGFLELESLRRVDDVGRGEAVVKPAGLGADVLGDRGGKGDDVVPDLGLRLRRCGLR